jgi:uncharacterized repeat protein (TIGR02543 family)
MAMLFVPPIIAPHQARAAAVEGTNWIQATASSSWSGRRALGTIANLRGDLWLLGGYNGNNPANGGRLTDIWSSTDGINWTDSGATMPGTPRTDETVLAFGGKLWILGGNTYSSGNLNDVWYSSDGTTWTEATSSADWPERSGNQALVFNDKMWILGGGDGSYMNDVWSSDDGITWTEATSSADWHVRGSFGATVYDNKMWVMGGVGGGYMNDVWYSTDGVTWTEATSSAPWPARRALTVTTYDNKMWVMGGDDDNGDQLGDVWSSTDGVTWTEATSSADWGAREYAAAQDFNGELWIFGGASGGQYLNDAWYTANLYDLSFDSQGGSSVSTIANQSNLASVTVPSAPTRAGYSFENWNTASDGSGTSYAPGDSYTMGSANATLYAIWQAAAQSSSSSGSHSGGSVRGQVANLEAMGNTATADALKAQWPSLFSATSSVPAASVATAAPLSVRDLESGMTGSDVLALQKLLNANGFPVAATGPGSSGSETSYFGSLTKAALAKYQEAHGIAPAAGYFGPLTRAQMKAAGLAGMWW